MLATLGRPPAGDDFAVEVKYDGQRGLVVVDDDGLAVFTRNGADVSRTFPELAGVRAAIGGRRAILDGEIVAVGSDGRPSFTRLQRRWPQQRRPSAELIREVPTRFLAFDALAVDGVDITGEPYGRRREILSEIMVVDSSPTMTVPRHWVDVSPADMLDVCAANAMEGIVAKRLDSPYRPGRSALWVKSMVRATAELAIVGHIATRAAGGSVATLLVAGHDEAGDLRLVGQVGTGMSQRERRRLFELLNPIEINESPVRNPLTEPGVRWVEPRYVGEIAYREYTPGRLLRHPSYKGLRDVTAADTRVPTPA
ncbi:Multifunctional non-homologous end joining DNA repair protein LigD [Mycolicibacterium vanbaalenii]|uniref:DNA ligase (ATP) n=1 Tax=Mycolicibacterium vanbaalenii TaxID=110539 RepID=A0A5S9R1J8_MYCVN|nr:non-homologous end-joining DNA ligase [Mycolicibacterium vanbaalenii]CAA0127335.1 Multifunctional non-homologous end joining DNA repair protein LigD [Mycolicibacterium vanbaalenii]